jgi:hypothetical protein
VSRRVGRSIHVRKKIMFIYFPTHLPQNMGKMCGDIIRPKTPQ